MRRRDREITAPEELREILDRASLLRLALVDGDRPYLVPMSFGGDDGVLYLHCAPRGRKLDILARNDRVCFEVSEGIELVTAADPCRWGLRYRSVIGTGRARLVTDPAEKRCGLDAIMARHGGRPPFAYRTPEVERTAVIRIDIETLTGKIASG